MTESQSCKFDNAVNLYMERVKKLEKEVNDFFNNVFTEDVIHMIREYNNCLTGWIIVGDKSNIRVYVSCANKVEGICFRGSYLILKEQFKRCYGICDNINELKSRIKDLKAKEESLVFYSNKVDTIIEEITDNYKEKVEKDEEDLEYIFNELGEETEKVRKCKVTVEWI